MQIGVADRSERLHWFMDGPATSRGHCTRSRCEGWMDERERGGGGYLCDQLLIYYMCLIESKDPEIQKKSNHLKILKFDRNKACEKF